MLFLVTNHMLGWTQTNSMKLRSCFNIKYQESEHVEDPFKSYALSYSQIGMKDYLSNFETDLMLSVYK